MNARLVLTALLSVAVLQQSLTPSQWHAVVIIFLSAGALSLLDVAGHRCEGKDRLTLVQQTTGLALSLSSTCCSALGGVALQYILRRPILQEKGSSRSTSYSTWEQQGTLAFFSLGCALAYNMALNASLVTSGHMAEGLDATACLVAVLQGIQVGSPPHSLLRRLRFHAACLPSYLDCMLTGASGGRMHQAHRHPVSDGHRCDFHLLVHAHRGGVIQ
jgi:hypothetical protein